MRFWERVLQSCTELHGQWATDLKNSSISRTIDLGIEIQSWISELRTRLLPALLEPVIAGYSFDKAPDLTDPAERARLSRNAITAFANIAEKWGLNEAQSRGLLGGIASSTYHAWKTGHFGKRLAQDTLMRISLVIGIYKALHIYFGKPWADRWVTLGNRGAIFAGQAPIEYMLRQGQPGMLQVRRMLDTWRGGR